jgi:plasmid maintenance system killer protein
MTCEYYDLSYLWPRCSASTACVAQLWARRGSVRDRECPAHKLSPLWQSYLTAATLHELECIKLHRRAMAQERCSAYCCPGGYRLHPLSGDRQGYWSVKVTGNWRITFRCEDGYAEEVNLEDYH